ncbi:MAG: hypothetical protein ABIR57_01460, partial [Aeromicrobium sp.]
MGRWTNLACLAGAIVAADQFKRSWGRAQQQKLSSADRAAAVAVTLGATDQNEEPFIAIVMSALNEATSIGEV